MKKPPAKQPKYLEQRLGCDEGQEVPRKQLLSFFNQNLKTKTKATKKTTPNHRTSRASCLDSMLLPLRNPNTCPENVSRIWPVTLLWMTLKYRCLALSIHFWLVTASYFFKSSTAHRAPHFQVTNFVPFQIANQIYHSFLRLMITD